MKRLRRVSHEDLKSWGNARLKAGRARYGNAHLRRYGVVDIMEELLDAQNIACLLWERARQGGLTVEQEDEIYDAIETLQVGLDRLSYVLYRLDRLLPDELCTDEQGGHRIWWSDTDE